MFKASYARNTDQYAANGPKFFLYIFQLVNKYHHRISPDSCTNIVQHAQHRLVHSRARVFPHFYSIKVQQLLTVRSDWSWLQLNLERIPTHSFHSKHHTELNAFSKMKCPLKTTFTRSLRRLKIKDVVDNKTGLNLRNNQMQFVVEMGTQYRAGSVTPFHVRLIDRIG
ncbi:MAG: hypothetical protein ABW125_17070 [Candidatus Thiodiazotropha lotti]